MLRHNNDVKEHAVRQKGMEWGKVEAGEVVIAPFEVEMLKALLKASRDPGYHDWAASPVGKSDGVFDWP
jgi:hypothetical protein